jgi:serine/threonine-protein kinase
MNRCARCSGELPSFAVFCPHCAQAHEPDFDQLINQTIDGRYRLYRRMGRGGLSTIFAATDLETDRVIAIKLSDPAQLVRRESSYAVEANEARSYWAEMLERMRREAETLTGIDHPHIVRFHGTGLINDDLRYVAMEFLRGRTLREEIDRDGIMESSAATRIALEVASALAEVHARGIVHRDINPRNIFLCEAGVKLIDFGIAKFPQPAGAPPFTQHSRLSGTVAYASPEQCRSQAIDHRSDIYSLGIVLYETLAGERPFNGRTPTEIALKQIQSPPPPPRAINPAIPPRLEKTILRALAKKPDERQQSVEELADELRGSLNQIFIPLPSAFVDEGAETLIANRAGMAEEADDEIARDEPKLVRRRRRRFTVTAAAALLLAILTAALLFGRHSLASRSIHSATPENAVATTSPSPEATFGSDADSLELAARMSSQSSAGNPNALATPASAAASPPSASSLPQAQSSAPVRSNSTANARPATHAATRTTKHSPTPAPAPAPVPPKAQPQMPPAPTPAIVIARAPQPVSEPDASQAPRRENDDGVWQRDTDNANNGSNRNTDRADNHDPNRSSNRGNNRPAPDRTQRSDEDDDDDKEDYPSRIGPKLIQWNGYVNREREIAIELPGVPGTVEIPRVYRDRVGVVEPPSPNNRWRCAVLRIFGRGNVSIVIRWWPRANHSGRFTAQR